jgi:hypothetical protein
MEARGTEATAYGPICAVRFPAASFICRRAVDLDLDLGDGGRQMRRTTRPEVEH